MSHITLFPSATTLKAMPTIGVGQSHDLKIVTHCTDFHTIKVWHSRITAADGELYDDTIYVEALTHDGHWIDLGHYDGNHPVETIGHYRPHDLGITRD